METFQTSFIPKKPVVAVSAQTVTPSSRMSFLSFISIFILIGMVVCSVGLYLYRASLVINVKNLQKSVTLAKDSFQPESIAELQVFDKRMTATTQILSSHVVLSPVFEALASLTIPSIQFTKFSIDPGADNKVYVVHMNGLARDYKSIAQQAEILNSNRGKYFKNVVFSNLVLQSDKTKKGYVAFDITFTVDSVLINYDNNILAEEKNKN